MKFDKYQKKIKIQKKTKQSNKASATTNWRPSNRQWNAATRNLGSEVELSHSFPNAGPTGTKPKTHQNSLRGSKLKGTTEKKNDLLSQQKSLAKQAQSASTAKHLKTPVLSPKRPVEAPGTCYTPLVEIPTEVGRRWRQVHRMPRSLRPLELHNPSQPRPGNSHGKV